MRKLLAVLLIFCFTSCGKKDYFHSYQYEIYNGLDAIVDIVPEVQSDFWISDRFTVLPGDKVVIGSKSLFGKNMKAIDIYEPRSTCFLLCNHS